MTLRILAALALAAAGFPLAVAACGGDDDEAVPATTASPAAAATTASRTAPTAVDHRGRRARANTATPTASVTTFTIVVTAGPPGGGSRRSPRKAGRASRARRPLGHRASVHLHGYDLEQPLRNGRTRIVFRASSGRFEIELHERTLPAREPPGRAVIVAHGIGGVRDLPSRNGCSSGGPRSCWSSPSWRSARCGRGPLLLAAHRGAAGAGGALARCLVDAAQGRAARAVSVGAARARVRRCGNRRRRIRSGTSRRRGSTSTSGSGCRCSRCSSGTSGARSARGARSPTRTYGCASAAAGRARPLADYPGRRGVAGRRRSSLPLRRTGARVLGPVQPSRARARDRPLHLHHASGCMAAFGRDVDPERRGVRRPVRLLRADLALGRPRGPARLRGRSLRCQCAIRRPGRSRSSP